MTTTGELEKIAKENFPSKNGEADARSESSRVYQEIMTTEQSYVDELSNLANAKDIILKAYNNITPAPGELSHSECKQLLDKLDEIVGMQGNFNQIIQKGFNPQLWKEKLSEMQSAYTDYFVLFYKFGTKKVPTEVSDSFGVNGLKISDILIMPVQRGPRYEMLSADLIKKMDPSHPMLEESAIFYEYSKLFTYNCNAALDKDDLQSKMQALGLTSKKLDSVMELVAIITSAQKTQADIILKAKNPKKLDDGSKNIYKAWQKAIDKSEKELKKITNKKDVDEIIKLYKKVASHSEKSKSMSDNIAKLQGQVKSQMTNESTQKAQATPSVSAPPRTLPSQPAALSAAAPSTKPTPISSSSLGPRGESQKQKIIATYAPRVPKAEPGKGFLPYQHMKKHQLPTPNANLSDVKNTENKPTRPKSGKF